MNKTLFFDGAGCVPCGEVENCRIRTAFKREDGETLFLEIQGISSTVRGSKAIFRGWVADACIVREVKGADGLARWEFDYMRRREQFEYCKSEILRVANEYAGGVFDSVEVLPTYHALKFAPRGEDCPVNLMEDAKK